MPPWYLLSPSAPISGKIQGCSLLDVEVPVWVIAALNGYTKGNHNIFLSFIDPKMVLKDFRCSSSALSLTKAAHGSRFQVSSLGSRMKLQTQTVTYGTDCEVGVSPLKLLLPRNDHDLFQCK